MTVLDYPKEKYVRYNYSKFNILAPIHLDLYVAQLLIQRVIDNPMKVAVIGCGFVGEAVADFLERHLIPSIQSRPPKYSLTLDDIVAKQMRLFCVCPHPNVKMEVVMTVQLRL